MVQTKSDRDKQRLITDKCQSLIEVLLKDEDNKYCVDCDAKGPRWASWNLGIFLCIRCAGIHRNLGVHISRVKSVNLDAWTPEHVAYVQRMGNSKARAIYEANLPDDFRRPQTDTALESFIRAKYEHKRYIDPGYVDPGPPPPAFNAEEELKKMKEQKRSKLHGGSNKAMISVSDSFVPAASSAPKKTISAISDPHSTSQPRPSPPQQQQQHPSLFMDSDGLTSSGNIGNDSFSGSTSSSSNTKTNASNMKPKSNLADLMDLDLGFGSGNLIPGNTSSTMTNPLAAFASSVNTTSTLNNNISANFIDNFNFDAPPAAPATAVPVAAAAAVTNSNITSNQSMTGSTGKNVFDLLDI